MMIILALLICIAAKCFLVLELGSRERKKIRSINNESIYSIIFEEN